MIENFTINGFKSYLHATIRFSALTVLVGANASGKSNAIEALRLVSWIAQGNRLGAIKYAVYESDQALRGTSIDLSYMKTGKFDFKIKTYNSEWPQFEIQLRTDEEADLHIIQERVRGMHSTVPLYEVVGPAYGVGNDLRVAYNNFARGGVKPQVTCTDQMAILAQLQSSARFEAGHKSAQAAIPQVCKYYQDTLSKVFFLDPQPSLMRGYSFQTDTKLKSDGSNISGVLYNLCENPDCAKDVLEFIQSLPEQSIASIGFVTTPRGEAMVQLTETFGSREHEFDASLLSDGTLRVLSIAAAVYSAEPGSLVVIEEIDNGVHPSRAEALLTNIQRVASRRGLQVLLSSHNPALLDALPDEAIPNVVFCYRDPESGGSRLVKLSDLPDFPSLVAQGAVGGLMTRGILDRFVKFHPGPALKRERAREWLSNLSAAVG